MSVETEANPLVAKIVESPEFKKAVKRIVENMDLEAGQISGLDSEIESVINNGSFEAETTVTFSS